MPEIKKQFTGGKMNKDVDERLVPNGEYRDAMNIQVATSEGSDVGTVQNILGNTEVTLPSSLLPGSTCVGSIADEKNDAFYWFVREPGTTWNQTIATSRDIILEHKNHTVRHVFIDTKNISIAVYGLQAPASGNIVINSQDGFDAINVGDTFQLWQNGVNISGNEFYEVSSKDPLNLYINIGDYTNVSWANNQGQGPGEFQIVPSAAGGVLKFPNHTITGINIVDDMLFWTDGSTEPKKINILRSIEGTNPNGLEHTKLVVNGVLGDNILEEHITVIKKAPSKPPKLVELTSIRQGGISGQTGAINFADAGGVLMPEGDIIWIAIDWNNSGAPPNYEVGDIIRLNDQAALLYPPENYKIRGLVNEIQPGPFTTTGFTASSTQHAYKITVLTLSSETPVMPTIYEVALEQEGFNLFERKFPRFACRYKYEDGEYSSIGPFSEVAFIPGNFRYHPTEAFNKAMINNLKELTLKDFIPFDMPKDVVQVDLLYRNDTSPSIYLLKSVRAIDDAWLATGSTAGLFGSYLVTTENISAQLPSNQSLRVWDNVPKTALAQEVTGSRVVYGNYTQGYDIIDSSGDLISPLIKSYLNVRSDNTGGMRAKKSIKSLRTYNFGIVYGDIYGRETPVLTHSDATQIVPKSQSPKSNSISINVENSHPAWADYYKVYVKETSNEYYNLAVDRLYDAQDGNVWVSFPSVDRNKVDEDTYLILKKGINEEIAVNEAARYKIVAIENEAPDYIKTTYTLLGEPNMQIDGFKLLGGTSTGATAVLVSPAEAPFPGHTSFSVAMDHWSEAYDPISEYMGLTNLKELWTANASNEMYVSFSNNVWVDTEFAKFESTRYLVTSITEDGDVFVVHINKPIPDSESWITDNLHDTWALGGQLRTHFFKKEVINKPEFDGRFFVKILEDPIVKSKLTSSLEVDDDWKVVASTDMYYLSDSGAPDATTTSDGSMTYPNTTGYTASGWNAGGTSSSGVEDGHLDEWDENLKFGGNQSRGGWFIDKAAYAGTQPLSTNDLFSSQTAGACVTSGNIYSEIKRYLDYTNYTFTGGTGLSNGTKFNKGLWTELDLNPTSSDVTNNISGALIIEMDDPVDSKMEVGDLITGGGIPVNNLVTVVAIEVGGELNKFEASQGISATAGDTLTFTGRTNHLALSYSRIDPSNGSNDINWGVGVPENTHTEDQEDIVKQLMRSKSKFRIKGSDVVYTIDNVTSIDRNYNFRGKVTFPEYKWINVLGFTHAFEVYNWEVQMGEMGSSLNRRLTYNIEYSPDESGIDLIDNPEVQTVTNTSPIYIEFIEEYSADQPNTISDKPAVFETEPKEDTDLDIYYEASGKIPTNTVGANISKHIPIGSVVTFPGGEPVPVGTTVVSWDGEFFTLSNAIVHNSLTNSISSQGGMRFVSSDGSYVSARYNGGPIYYDGAGILVSDRISLVSTSGIGLAWFNCWSFNNGVESNRIGDTYNKPFITNGVKASTTLDDEQRQEHRKYGLIYSGLYNSTSGINSLNQFIAAEKITKDLNPTYGSIQKLHSRSSADGDLIALCEDRVLKILANKDAVFNADGNPQLTATDRVLGQAIPFSGEYGISKNPESFASESYRAYFTDKVRGSVIRLSKDGLTAISDHGMKDYFKDNLKLSTKLIGSYDDKKDEYNITLFKPDGTPLSQQAIGANYSKPETVSFREDVRGWVSFKSFTPENAISCASEYYTFKNGKAWKHHVESVNRNTFYGIDSDPEVGFTNSSFVTLFNDMPGGVKSFSTVNYEGSQARVSLSLDSNGTIVQDGDYFNLTPLKGWFVDSAFTNLEKGSVSNFIEKEGKWFGFINGDNITSNFFGITTENFDTSDFSIQGIGVLNSTPTVSSASGCTDATAFNYQSAATVDDGSCYAIIYGCMDTDADNFIPLISDILVDVNTSDSSCLYYGCTIVGSFNFDPTANLNDGSCVAVVYGCTNPTQFGFNTLANTDDGSCTPFVYGCMDDTTPGGCGPGCDGALNYNSLANTGDGLCTYAVPGCMNFDAWNYSSSATYQPIAVDTCKVCGDTAANNYDYPSTYPIPDDYSGCIYCPATTGFTATASATVATEIDLQWDLPLSNLNVVNGGDYMVSVTDVVDGTTVNTSITPGSSGPYLTHTITGLSAGTDYSITIQAECSNTDGPTSSTEYATTIHIIGCMDEFGEFNGVPYAWPACNFNPLATSQTGGVVGYSASDCNYNCAGCMDANYAEFCNTCYNNGPYIYDDGSCVTLISYGCTDVQPDIIQNLISYPYYTNFDNSAGVLACCTLCDGSDDNNCCIPTVLGCTDASLNNNGSANASSTYDPNLVPLANTDDGSCVYGCPTIQLTTTSYASQNDFGFQKVRNQLGLGATVYSKTPIGTNDVPDGFSVSVTVYQDNTSGTVLYTNSNLGGFTASSQYWYMYANLKLGIGGINLTAGQQTSIAYKVELIDDDGVSCPVTTTTTYSLGCTDSNATNDGTFDFTDNSYCSYVGCTDNTQDTNGNYFATNYNPSPNTIPCTDNSGGSTGPANLQNTCCTYSSTLPTATFTPVNHPSTPLSMINNLEYSVGGTAYNSATIGYLQVNSHLLGQQNSVGGTYQNPLNIDGIGNGTSYLSAFFGGTSPQTWTVSTTNTTVVSTLLSQHIAGGTSDWSIVNPATFAVPPKLKFEYTVNFKADVINPSLGNVKTYQLTGNQEWSIGCKYSGDDAGVTYTSTNSNLDASLDMHVTGSCVLNPIPGCTTTTAINYNPAATADDGTCCLMCKPPTAFVVNNPTMVSGYATYVNVTFGDVCEATSYTLYVQTPSVNSDTVTAIQTISAPVGVAATTSVPLYSGVGVTYPSGAELTFTIETTCSDGSTSSLATSYLTLPPA